METSLKTGFAQIFSRCPKKSELPKIWGGAAAPLAPPARTPMSATQSLQRSVALRICCSQLKNSIGRQNKMNT